MQLAPDVYAVSVEGDLVFLDARRDHYSCLTRSDAAHVLSLLGCETYNGEIHDVARELVENGLLVPGEGRTLCFVARESATADFHMIAAPAPPNNALALWRLAGAAVEAGLKSRGRPSRWLRARARREVDAPVSRAATLALQFDRLRPWIPWSGRCLPNSLLLIAFLRRHGIAADLVLGVHTFPFEAHSWVEYRGVVLNDVIEHVRWYTPIAVA